MDNVLEFPERRTLGWVDPITRAFLGFSVHFSTPHVAAYVRLVDGEWQEAPKPNSPTTCKNEHISAQK